MHGNNDRVRKRANNSSTCWVLLLLTASSMVTELLAKSFVVLELLRYSGISSRFLSFAQWECF